MKDRVWTALRALCRECYDGAFGPQTATDLAICRIVVYGYVFRYLMDDESAWGFFCGSLYKPLGLFKWLSLPCLSPGALHVCWQLFQYSTLAACLGLGFRVAAPLAGLLGVYLIGLGNQFGKVFHSTNAMAVTLLVWSLSRAADKWSLDALIVSRWRREPVKEPAPSGEYRWPIRVVWVFTLSMYAASGYAKFHSSGWDWAFTENLRRLFLDHQFNHKPPTNWGLFLYDYPQVCQWMAFFALLTELGAPLALLHRYLRALVAPAVAGLQLGIYLLMGIVFHAMIPLFLCFVPWSSLGRALAPLVARIRAREARAPVIA